MPEYWGANKRFAALMAGTGGIAALICSIFHANMAEITTKVIGNVCGIASV